MAENMPVHFPPASCCTWRWQFMKLFW